MNRPHDQTLKMPGRKVQASFRRDTFLRCLVRQKDACTFLPCVEHTRTQVIAVVLSFLLLCFGGALLHAQETNPNATVTMQTLGNGVRVLLKPEPETEIVAVTALISIAPARNEQEAAAAEIAARAMFYGSVNQSYRSMMRSVAETGGRWEIVKTRDYLGISAMLPATQLGEALYLLSDAVRNATFSSESLALARQEILDARTLRDKEPFAALRSVIVRSFTPFAEPDEFSLKRVTPAAATTWFQSQILPNRLVVSIVGKFNRDQAARALDLKLSNWKGIGDRGQGTGNKTLSDPMTQRPNDLSYFPRLPYGRAAYALIGMAAPDITHPDYPAFVVMHTALGSGHASRLFRRIREEKGIGYSVGTFFAEDRSEPLIAYLQWDSKREFTQKEARLEPLQLLNAQIDGLVIEPPTAAEVTRARNVAIGKDALRHEHARDRAFLLTWYEAVGLGWQFDMSLPQRLAAVTPEDVLRVAKIYLPKRVTIVAQPKPEK
jgi:zinc protease